MAGELPAGAVGVESADPSVSRRYCDGLASRVDLADFAFAAPQSHMADHGAGYFERWCVSGCAARLILWSIPLRFDFIGWYRTSHQITLGVGTSLLLEPGYLFLALNSFDNNRQF